MKKSALLLTFTLSRLVFTACEGIFGGLYDEPLPKTEYGFIETKEDNSGTIYIDATSYTRWTYVNLKRKRIDTANIPMGQAAPEEWDFALHRYDVQTNGGSAYETNFSSLEQLREEGIPAAAFFTPDSLSRIAIDMSGMMDGIIVYDTCPLNFTLSRWIEVNTSTMPPVYTLSMKPYVLRLSDGSHAGLLFSNFTNASLAKGYITINYIYPL